MVGAPVKPTGPPAPPLQKPRPDAPRRETGASKRGDRPALFIRVAISLLIAWHFAGVFLAALSIPASSPLVMRLSQGWPMQWYLDALYMNQGHSFFAPDVGPGHVVRYELQYAGGQTTQSELPSRKEQWPRLFYHRHMMLADQSDMPTDDKQMSDRWQRKYLQAYGRHLLRVNESAQAVRLQRIAHWPLPRELAEKGTAITDPQGYDLLVEVTVRRSELGPDAVNPAPPKQSYNWQNNRPNVANRGLIGIPR